MVFTWIVFQARKSCPNQNGSHPKNMNLQFDKRFLLVDRGSSQVISYQAFWYNKTILGTHLCRKWPHQCLEFQRIFPPKLWQEVCVSKIMKILHKDISVFWHHRFLRFTPKKFWTSKILIKMQKSLLENMALRLSISTFNITRTILQGKRLI